MQISRKWEKIIAWTSNVLLLLATLLMWALTSLGFNQLASISPLLQNIIDASIRQEAYENPLMLALLGTSGGATDMVLTGVSFLLKLSLILMIVALFLTFIASFAMRKRKFSAILFVLAGLIALPTIGFFTSPLYFVVAILLLVRK